MRRRVAKRQVGVFKVALVMVLEGYGVLLASNAFVVLSKIHCIVVKTHMRCIAVWQS